MPGGAGKICACCGETCEGQPRVKDRHGRYYHERCHGRAQKQQWKRQEQIEHAPSAAFANADTSAGDTAAVAALVLEATSDSTGSSTATGHLSATGDLSAAAIPTPASHNGASAALFACPTCGGPVEPGAVLCLRCGYSDHPAATLYERIGRIITAPISLGIGWLISPKTIGIIIIAFMAALIALAFYSDTGERIFIGSYIALFAAATVWAVVVAFRFGSSHGFLTLFVPFYILYTVYALNENDYLKWMYSAHLMCIPAVLVFYLDSIGVMADIGLAL